MALASSSFQVLPVKGSEYNLEISRSLSRFKLHKQFIYKVTVICNVRYYIYQIGYLKKESRFKFLDKYLLVRREVSVIL